MTTNDARLQGCTHFKLRQLVRRVSQLYDAELSKAGLKTTQFSLLSHVLRLGPIRPGDLAQAMTLDASTPLAQHPSLVPETQPRNSSGSIATSE